MKKYYLIYAAFGAGFLICCSMVFLNSDALSDPDPGSRSKIKPMFNGYFVDKITGPSTAGNIAMIAFIAIIVIAIIARIVYVLYKYMKKLREQDEKDNTPDLPETLDKNSMKNIFSFLLSARRGWVDRDSLRDDEEKRNRRYKD